MGMAVPFRVDGIHQCLVSDIKRGRSHSTAPLPLTTLLSLSQAQEDTNGIKQSVNIFFQLRKVKGFASLFQETRGI